MQHTSLCMQFSILKTEIIKNPPATVSAVRVNDSHYHIFVNSDIVTICNFGLSKNLIINKNDRTSPQKPLITPLSVNKCYSLVAQAPAITLHHHVANFGAYAVSETI